MTAVSIPLLQDPLYSITGEGSNHVYPSKPFMLLSCMAMLVIEVFPLLLVQYHIYRMRQTLVAPPASGG
jgi:hypothetical protein